MTIIDKRDTKSSSSADSKKKYLDRYKYVIKKRIDEQIYKDDITDTAKKDKLKIKIKKAREYQFTKDPSSGATDNIFTGNKTFNKGDKIPVDQNGQGQGSGGGNGGQGESDEDFTFVLSRSEFMDLLFEDMELPNFIKESLAKSKTYIKRRAGYQKEGPPSKLDLKKTFMEAFKRKLCSKQEKPPFLDDEDLRYRRHENIQIPIKHATVFFILDVSMSMSPDLRYLAKKFFLLLFLFLEKNYEEVEVRFIVHSDIAKEVDEEEFFHNNLSGGTIMSSAMKLVAKEIKKCYNTNIYIAHASDGDNWSSDDEYFMSMLEEVLPNIQFYCYLETKRVESFMYGRHFSLSDKMKEKFGDNEKVATEEVYHDEDVLPILRKLFKKK